MMSFHKNLREDDLHGPSIERVKNATGSSISALKVVKFVGVDTATGYPLISPISDLLDCPRGITKTVINDNEAGYVAGYSIMSNVDTSSYSLEQKLYSDANGNLTTSKTTLFIAQVLRVDASSGVLFVKPEVVESAGMVDVEEKTINLVANTPQNVTAPTLDKITSVEIVRADNKVVTDSLCVDILTTPVMVTITGNQNINNLKVIMSGEN